jgi:hypothetical protein
MEILLGGPAPVYFYHACRHFHFYGSGSLAMDKQIFKKDMNNYSELLRSLKMNLEKKRKPKPALDALKM